MPLCTLNLSLDALVVLTDAMDPVQDLILQHVTIMRYLEETVAVGTAHVDRVGAVRRLLVLDDYLILVLVERMVEVITRPCVVAERWVHHLA